MKISRFMSLSLLLCSYLSPAVGSGEITIGTGSSSGIYYQSGRAICRLLNAGTDAHGIICAPKISPGSISNLKRVRDGELELGIAQSDAQYNAVNGAGKFSSTGPDHGLRSLFSLHDEAFTLVARSDSGINSFDDLRGKRVNIGNPGSGQLATMEEVMKLKGWNHSVFSLANQLPANQQSMALCHNRVQAMVYMVGHPNPSVAQAESLCNAVIIEVKDKEIDSLVEQYPFYTYAQVPGGLYAGNPKPVQTFGVKATMVASKNLDADTVYEIVKAVFGDLDKFRSMHPAFSGLKAEEMVSDGLTAPLHAGARRYYVERGWISK